MRRLERETLNELIKNVEAMLNKPPTVNPQIRDIDVLEALLGDLQKFAWGDECNEVAELKKLDDAS